MGLFSYDGEVFYVKTAHEQGGSRLQDGFVSRHVGQQDVAVDVGLYPVEGSTAAQ